MFKVYQIEESRMKAVSEAWIFDIPYLYTSVPGSECYGRNDGLQSILQVLLPPASSVPRHLHRMMKLEWTRTDVNM